MKETIDVDLPHSRDQIGTKELPGFARLRASVFASIKEESLRRPVDTETHGAGAGGDGDTPVRQTGAMDSVDAVRGPTCGWLAANWDPDLALVEWRRRLAAAGWAAPSWPERWHGRSLPPWADEVVADEIAAAGGGPAGRLGYGPGGADDPRPRARRAEERFLRRR